MEILGLQLVDFNGLAIEVPEKRILMSGREQKEMKKDHEDVQKRFIKQRVVCTAPRWQYTCRLESQHRRQSMNVDLVVARETGGRQMAPRALTELPLQKQGYLQCLQWQAVGVRMCHKSAFFLTN